MSTSPATDDLDRLVAAVLFPGFEGVTTPAWLDRWLRNGLGGVVLFGRNVVDPDQLAELTAAVRDHRPDALCAIDEEGGDVTRLFARTGSPHPGHLALGAADDVDATRQVAADIGARLRAAGVDWNLAPDADVNSNPANPVIGVRSFGAEPGLVARHVRAYVEGLQDDAGVVACAKHFPGHGDTDVDSHLGAPVLDRDRSQLESVELVPFRAAIDGGVRSIMTGHLLVNALDPALPATVSPALVDGLLRTDLGFEGVVMSDALEMAGVAAAFGIERAAVLSLLAGVDALCLGGALADEDVVLRAAGAIRAAVVDGELPELRLVEAAGRLTSLVDWCRSRGAPHPTASVPHAVAREVGDAAIPQGPAFVITLDPAPGIAAGWVPWGVDTLVAAARPGSGSLRLGADDVPDAALAAAQGRPLVLVVRDPHRHPWEQRSAEAVLAARPDAVVVDMGVPSDVLSGLSRGAVLTYGASAASAAAALRVLCPDLAVSEEAS